VAQILDAAPASPATPPGVTHTPDAAPPSPVDAAQPRPGDRYRDLVNAAQRIGKSSCSSAVSIYESAIDLNPRGSEAFTGLARCLLELKDYDRAISNFRAALAISHRNPEALIGAAEAYQLKGNVPAAITYYKGYLEAAPRGAHAELARSNLAKLGQGEDPLRSGKPK
jgi:tetratricopeptide (TPR) repeat protein